MTSRPKTPLLDTVNTPDDLRKLGKDQLRQLSDELRAEMIDAVGQALDMAKEHRARAASTHPMPGTVDIRPFLSGFLAFGNLLSDFGRKNFCATAG